MKKDLNQQEVTLEGIITVSKWDEDNNIIGVALSTLNERDYHIENNDKGVELLGFITKYVKITGFIEKNNNGHDKIVVKKYQLLSFG